MAFSTTYANLLFSETHVKCSLDEIEFNNMLNEKVLTGFMLVILLGNLTVGLPVEDVQYDFGQTSTMSSITDIMTSGTDLEPRHYTRNPTIGASTFMPTLEDSATSSTMTTLVSDSNRP